AGVRLLEVTFDRGRTPEANAARVALVVRLGLPGLRVGAGTVLTPDEVTAAADAGAEFVLSPDTREQVIRATKRLGLFSIPGALTPSEVGRAHDAGADVVKIFPAALLGPGYLRELHGPLPDVAFCAVGGVSVANARAFLDGGAVCVGVGSALLPRASDGTIDLPAVTQSATALLGVAHADR
ncbi:MAG TPA: bifunctional 4-hydroxy-2-oxoglutarate aldolase/2-dehydro-3-deoxy-phosphogluconate aldolase, partial [Cellulomonas sp.]